MTVDEEKKLDELLEKAGYELFGENMLVEPADWYILFDAMMQKEQETLH